MYVYQELIDLKANSQITYIFSHGIIIIFFFLSFYSLS